MHHFELVAIRGTLAFSSFYFEQNVEKLINIINKVIMPLNNRYKNNILILNFIKHSKY